MANILNQAQAEAVYGAMVALNNVGGVLRTNIDDLRIEDDGDGIRIMKALRTVEQYADQAAFATTYGLN